MGRKKKRRRPDEWYKRLIRSVYEPLLDDALEIIDCLLDAMERAWVMHHLLHQKEQRRRRRPVDPQYDEALRRLHAGGKSYAQIARREGMQREAVRAAVRRARRRR